MLTGLARNFLACLVLVPINANASEGLLCKGVKYEDISTLNASMSDPKDGNYLTHLMSFSYGTEAQKFAKLAQKGISQIFSREKGQEQAPLVTILKIDYRDQKSSEEAFSYLLGRWLKSNEHSVFKVEKSVIWIGNNGRVPIECFQEFVADLRKASDST
jgi:hypothetical protein